MGLSRAERERREAEAAFSELSEEDQAALAELSEEDAAKLVEYAKGIAALADVDPSEVIEGEPVAAPSITELTTAVAIAEQQFSSGKTTRKARDAARERLRAARGLA